MSNEFKDGWYFNSKETQERLFELGYRWSGFGDEISHLTREYIFTCKDGGLAFNVFGYGVGGVPKGTQLDKEDNIVSNEFKRGWYINSRETQEQLFDLGYRWSNSRKVVKYLNKKYIFTNNHGDLTFSNIMKQPTERGTQLDNTPHKHCKLIKAWADGAKIQYKSCVTGNWHDDIDPLWIPTNRYRIKPEESEEYTKLKSVIYELEDNLNKAKKKLEEL